MLNALELTIENFNEAFDDLVVESCELIPNTNPVEYAAMYLVTFEDDDDSFPDEESRHHKVFVHYRRNGTIMVDL